MAAARSSGRRPSAGSLARPLAAPRTGARPARTSSGSGLGVRATARERLDRADARRGGHLEVHQDHVRPERQRPLDPSRPSPAFAHPPRRPGRPAARNPSRASGYRPQQDADRVGGVPEPGRPPRRSRSGREPGAPAGRARPPGRRRPAASARACRQPKPPSARQRLRSNPCRRRRPGASARRTVSCSSTRTRGSACFSTLWSASARPAAAPSLLVGQVALASDQLGRQPAAEPLDLALERLGQRGAVERPGGQTPDGRRPRPASDGPARARPRSASPRRPAEEPLGRLQLEGNRR